jgi:cyclic-di-GMP-binding protein
VRQSDRRLEPGLLRHNGQTSNRQNGVAVMAAENSFDVVSKVDRQEVDNALNQAAKEVRQRFDFKNTDAGISWSGQQIEMQANSEERVKAVLDVFQSKLVRRGVSLKALDAGEPRSSGKLYKITASTKEGINAENAKKVAKLIRDEGPKGVKTQIQGDEMRVSSKSRDDLQAVQALIKAQDYDFAVQFTNYR